MIMAEFINILKYVATIYSKASSGFHLGVPISFDLAPPLIWVNKNLEQISCGPSFKPSMEHDLFYFL